MKPLRLVGSDLKKEGLEKVSSHNQRWLAWARSVAHQMWELKGEVTSDDVRECCDMFDRQPDHKNAFGAIFRREDGWKKAGYTPSRRPKAHGREIAVWVKERSDV